MVYMLGDNQNQGMVLMIIKKSGYGHGHPSAVGPALSREMDWKISRGPCPPW